jgi:hypothetical protein
MSNCQESTGPQKHSTSCLRHGGGYIFVHMMKSVLTVSSSHRDFFACSPTSICLALRQMALAWRRLLPYEHFRYDYVLPQYARQHGLQVGYAMEIAVGIPGHSTCHCLYYQEPIYYTYFKPHDERTGEFPVHFRVTDQVYVPMLREWLLANVPGAIPPRLNSHCSYGYVVVVGDRPNDML